MHFVYVLEAIKQPEKRYIGMTSLTVEQRLAKHNAGEVPSTKSHLPWRILSYIAVTNLELAVALEDHLKTGSGREFIRKRLEPAHGH